MNVRFLNSNYKLWSVWKIYSYKNQWGWEPQTEYEVRTYCQTDRHTAAFDLFMGYVDNEKAKRISISISFNYKEANLWKMWPLTMCFINHLHNSFTTSLHTHISQSLYHIQWSVLKCDTNVWTSHPYFFFVIFYFCFPVRGIGGIDQYINIKSE